MSLNKNYFLFAVFAVTLVSFSFMVGAVTFANMITPVNITTQGSNISTSTYTLEVWINESAAESLIGNVTWYYQPWSYLNNGSWITIGTTENTSNNQSVFTKTWDTTAITDGKNYTINATALNYDPVLFASGVNATNITGNVTIDNTAPTILIYSGATLTALVNGTIRTNATLTGSVFPNNLTLNISITDSLFQINSSDTYCFVNVAGKTAHNRTAVYTDNQWCNFTNINITGLGDGNHTIDIYVNDSLNNVRYNNTFHVQVDTTAPGATASCSPTTIQTGASFPCTCSGTDATSGLSTSTGTSTSPDATGTPGNTGTFTYTCSTADYGGLTATSTATYIVNQVPGGGASSGSGPGSSTSSVTATVVPAHIFSDVKPGVASVKEYTDPSLALKEVQIQVNNQAQNVKVSVTKYDGKPAEVSVEKTGKVYQYIQIKVDNVADKLDKAMVKFKVERSWVSDNGLTKDQVAVSKFNEDSKEWMEQTTSYSSEDDTFYYYDVELRSFSYFAVSSKSTTEGGAESGATGSSDGVTGASSGGMSWLIWVVIGIVIIVAVLVGMGKRK